METRAVRLYGASDLKLDEFELREINDDEILASVVCDSICMSTYKAAKLGIAHKRVPKDIDKNPVIMGHEFTGEIIKVGRKWANQFKPGTKYAVQPNINSRGIGYAPGYSFTDFGGNATYIIIPSEVMEKGALLNYDGDSFFAASLAEPMACIIAAFKAFYHTGKESAHHVMGIKEGGAMAILAGAGPMGLGAIDYAVHTERKPSTLLVTDIDDKKLERAKRILKPEDVVKEGVKLVYLNTSRLDNPSDELIKLNDGKAFDDVFVFAPVPSVIETGNRILGKDGCLNFFAGPTDKQLNAKINFYDVHYSGTHIVGTSGSSNKDMMEAIRLLAESKINPSVMVTHIGGLNSAAKAILNLPNIPGGKKLIYNRIDMELTALEDMPDFAKQHPEFSELLKIIEDNNGLWTKEAEKFLLGLI